MSLLLRARLAPPVLEIGGARPLDGLPRPGIAGAPPIGGPAEAPDGLSTCGADLSFVTAFLSRVPLVMSVKRAPWSSISSKCPIQPIASPFSLTLSLATVGGGLAGRLFEPGAPPGGAGGGGGLPPKPGGGGGGGGGGGAGMLWWSGMVLFSHRKRYRAVIL